MAADLKSFSLVLAVMAGFPLLVGAAVSSPPVRAEQQSPDTRVGSDPSPRLVEETLIARGNALLEVGDFASARLLFQAAANRGSGRAAMLTGLTFDPRYRELAGASEPQADASLARRWYALAIQRGDPEARRNDLDLVQWLKDRNIDPDAGAEPATEAAVEPEPEPETQPAEDETAVSLEEPPSRRAEMTPAPTPGNATLPTPDPAEAAGKGAGPDPTDASAEPSTETPVAVAAAPSMEPPMEAPIADDRVVRAQLTSAVEDREPVDRLASSIRVSDGGVQRIVFFSEVHDLSGQTLSHRWEREGQTMADVSFVIGSGAWRMHSSKRVTAAMTGAWRVVVVDEVGAELASVPFVLE